MAAKNIDILDFYIFYTKTGEPPSYVEAVLLYNYFKRNNKLPVLNNAFWLWKTPAHNMGFAKMAGDVLYVLFCN